MTRLHRSALWFGIDVNDVDMWIAAAEDNEDVRWLVREAQEQGEEHEDE